MPREPRKHVVKEMIIVACNRGRHPAKLKGPLTQSLTLFLVVEFVEFKDKSLAKAGAQVFAQLINQLGWCRLSRCHQPLRSGPVGLLDGNKEGKECLLHLRRGAINVVNEPDPRRVWLLHRH